jgi:hypothetical protein
MKATNSINWHGCDGKMKAIAKRIIQCYIDSSLSFKPGSKTVSYGSPHKFNTSSQAQPGFPLELMILIVLVLKQSLSFFDVLKKSSLYAP